jgi:hypothetical protein
MDLSQTQEEREGETSIMTRPHTRKQWNTEEERNKRNTPKYVKCAVIVI